jgi:hypothetical protein
MQKFATVAAPCQHLCPASPHPCGGVEVQSRVRVARPAVCLLKQTVETSNDELCTAQRCETEDAQGAVTTVRR